MLARFECPRCQTVFTREKGDDDAFVECPSCGALAMSVGDATGVDSDALARALSSSHDAPTQLLGGALGSTEDPSSMASSESPPEPSAPVERNDPLQAGGAGIFSGLMDRPIAASEPSAEAPPVADEPPPPPPPAVASGKDVKISAPRDGIDLGLDDDFKDFSLPSTSPGSAALSPQKKTPAKKPPKKPEPRAASSSSDDPDPNASPVDRAALSEDAFGALEAAFDSMAAKPTGNIRGKDGLSDDDRRFLQGEKVNESPPERATPRAAPPKRPPARPGQRPPPRNAAKRPVERERSRGIALSDEAREAAFLPLRPSAAPPLRRKSSGTPGRSEDEDEAPPPSSSAEHTAPQQAAPRKQPKLVTPNVEPTDIVAKKGKAPPAVREKPSIMGGLPAIALTVAVFVGLVGGAATGALTAPVAVKRNDARGRAELQLAEGNKFYEEGRFDDALGKYKGAVNIDRTFALAHRAKGAALAKQQRWDEAADAYKEYLGLESAAIDAGDVKEALARRGVLADKATEKAGGT
ncbi:MAG: tetratricopeptide repeat protein [Deltaproteobacteria bacterium]|nr:tetratricopeptide repeat protein [Deltaproteobacteria bacterium]